MIPLICIRRKPLGIAGVYQTAARARVTVVDVQPKVTSLVAMDETAI